MAADFDEVLEELGHFGRYQRINYALFFLPIFLSSAFTLSFAFTAGEPIYRCLIPECEDKESSLSAFYPPWLSDAVPIGNGRKPSTCERYAVNPKFHWTNGSCPASAFIKNTTLECSEFVYYGNEITIMNEFHLNCLKNKWKLTLVGTMNFIGQFLGLPVAGLLSDRFGRRTVMVGAMVMSSVCGISKSFAPNYPTFVTFEFLEPLLGSAVYPAAFILALELVGRSRRTAGSAFINVSYSLGVAYLGLIAYLLPNWRKMLLALYGPGLLFVSYFWLVPESVRWLMSRGRMKAAGLIVRKAAHQNGVELSTAILSIFNKTQEVEENYNPGRRLVEPNPETERDIKRVLREVLTSKISLIRLAINCVCWMIATMVYYGLSIGAVDMFGNKYLNFAMVALVETPGSILAWPAMERLGRRYSLVFSFALSAVTCAAVPFIPVGEEWLPILVFLLGKVCITSAFNILYTYSSEMFPTTLRSSMLSICSTFGRLGSMLAPQAPLLAAYWDVLPFIVFGSAALIASGLALMLPETLNANLPNSVKEAEELGMRTPQRAQNT